MEVRLTLIRLGNRKITVVPLPSTTAQDQVKVSNSPAAVRISTTTPTPPPTFRPVVLIKEVTPSVFADSFTKEAFRTWLKHI